MIQQVYTVQGLVRRQVEEPSEEQLTLEAQERLNNISENNRGYRDALLSNSDWTQVPDSPLTDEVKTSWLNYRTLLRDLPNHENWPDLLPADWPTEPS
jgi:hypothetical protein